MSPPFKAESSRNKAGWRRRAWFRSPPCHDGARWHFKKARSIRRWAQRQRRWAIRSLRSSFSQISFSTRDLQSTQRRSPMRTVWADSISQPCPCQTVNVYQRRLGGSELEPEDSNRNAWWQRGAFVYYRIIINTLEWNIIIFNNEMGLPSILVRPIQLGVTIACKSIGMASLQQWAIFIYFSTQGHSEIDGVIHK